MGKGNSGRSIASSNRNANGNAEVTQSINVNPWRGTNQFASRETENMFIDRYGLEIGVARYRVALVQSQIANENRARKWDRDHGIKPNEFDDARLDDLKNDLILAQRALRRAQKKA